MSTPTKTSVEMPALPRYTVACASDEYGAHWHVESYSDGSLCLFSEAEAALRERDEFWRALIADDAYAMSFQTMGQYRSALLAALKGEQP